MTVRIRPRADDERVPWNVDVDYGCQWPDCEWRNGFLVVERDGEALGATCTMHRFRSPDEWAEALP